MGDVPLWEAEKVKLFRGPRTTTQGQNAIAGVIFVNTEDPAFGSKAEASAALRNLNSRQGTLTVDVPTIEDALALHVAVDARTHQSFVNVVGISEDQITADAEKDDHRNLQFKSPTARGAAPD
ncbi:MAG: hypothetical protein AAF666_19445 [Pseudomonadota bacterium]